MEQVSHGYSEQPLADTLRSDLNANERVADGYMPPFAPDRRQSEGKIAERDAIKNSRSDDKMTIERQNTFEGKFMRGFIFTLVHLFFRPKVYYINKAAQDKVLKRPCIIIANHTHIADGPLVGAVLRGKINYLAAGDMYNRRALTRLLYDCGCIPIARMNVDTQWIKESRNAIKKGRSICIFPEGGKFFEDYEVHKFRSGFVMIAMGSDTEILPVYIEGLYYFIFGPRQRVMIGEPMRLSPVNGRNIAEYVDAETKRFHDYEEYLKVELYKRTKKKSK